MHEDLAAAVRDALEGPPGVDRLGDLVDLLRPARGRPEPVDSVRGVVAAIAGDADLRARLTETVRVALADLTMAPLLVESGVLDDESVLTTLRAAFGEWVLPPVFATDDARAAIPRVFRRRNDHRWVMAVPTGEWSRLLDLALPATATAGSGHAELGLVLQRLAQRISGAGTDAEIEGKRGLDEGHGTPFLELPIATRALVIAADEGGDASAALGEVLAQVRAARRVVRQLREEKSLYGTSLRLTRLTRRLDQQLRRFELLCGLVRPDDRTQMALTLAVLLKDLIRAEQSGRRLRTRIVQGVDLLAYEVTEHTAAKGKKYVSGTRSAYFAVLKAALLGGAWVGIFAIVKLLAKKLDLPLAVEAFLFGLNYAVCFVLIYATGGTLATKQPAVTASAIAKQLDVAESRSEGFDGVALSVERIWRTQFVAFLGNLLFAFPFAALFGLMIEKSRGTEVIGVAKAEALLEANHPLDGPTLFYAAIAGLFLFVAGLVQGAVDNRVVYTRLEARLAEHPRLRWLGSKRASMAKTIAKHAGGISSNVILGFLLGSAGVFGRIFGLPIDIRHIAFSSAHVGVAVLDAPQLVDAREAAILIVGVLAIGFVNFIVSFGLTLGMALASRQVTTTQGGALLRLLFRRFAASPVAWFLPVEKGAGPTDPDVSASD